MMRDKQLCSLSSENGCIYCYSQTIRGMNEISLASHTESIQE